MDQVGEAARALQSAEDGVERAQERARKIVADARQKVTDARSELARRIADAYLRGGEENRVGALARRSGYNRETVRRILRAAGIEPD